MGRPTGRKTNNTGSGNVFKRGSGLNLGGRVGNSGGLSGRPGMGSSDNRSGGIGGGSGLGGAGLGCLGASLLGGKKKLGCLGTIILILIVVFILVRCGGLFTDGLDDTYTSGQTFQTQAQSSQSTWDDSDYTSQDTFSGLYGSYGDTTTGSYGAYATSGLSNDSGKLDTSVAAGSRAKYTQIKGNGADDVTVMVYMCGTDLESKNGAATSDLQEMLYASDTDKINVLVYTGGCRQWKNNVISNSVNQIYKVEPNGLKRVKDDAGSGAMTNPDTLSSFIKWAGSNYPANRYELIFWDHGGGSVTGYGYDEKNTSAGSMPLTSINKALKNAGLKFDFIGFDACLMATLETGLMLDPYADYMIASEETEPADGWYYTDWLSKLGADTSVPTLELAKDIADSYYKANEKYSSYSGITLSVVDLAELSSSVPATFADFATEISDKVNADEYQVVSNARSKTKEFAASSKIDQVDLVNLADNLSGTKAEKLIDAIKSAVKYNITSSNMSTAYGLSIFFPYRSLSDVDAMASTYESLGLSDEYAKCISDFASQQTTGQISTGGSWNPYGSLFGGGGSSYSGGSSGYGGYDYSGSSGGSNYSGSMTSDLLMELLSSAMSGQYSGISGLSADRMGYMKNANAEKNAEYVMTHSLDPTKIAWTENANGQKILDFTEEDWQLVDNIYLNVLFDDGEGYIDLGMDTVYNWDDEGNLIGEYDQSWMAVDGQPVAYYHVSTEGDENDYTIRGYIPAFVNGERANLLVEFTDEHEDGIIYGVQRVYDEGETDTQAKLYELEDGDVIDFVCDFYSYDGEFENNYYLGNQMTVSGTPVISNVTIGDKANAAYRITDIYNQNLWTPLM